MNVISRINVLHIVSNLQFGGAEKQVVTILKNLDKNKYRVILCCLYRGGPLEQEIKNEDIRIVFVKMRFRYLFSALYKLVCLMRNEKIQIVHTHLYSDHLWGRIAAWIARVPVIITTEHGRGMWKRRHHLLFDRIANHFTDLRIAVSEDIRQIRIEREHTDPRKIITIPNAVNPDDYLVSDDINMLKRKELGIEGDELIVGTVARLDPDKALDLLLEAAFLVSKLISNIRIVIVGDGNQKEYLRKYAESLGLSNKVIFTGVRSDVAELLSIMDIYVNSSLREGISVSLLEAMAARKSVIATNVGGNAEVINRESCGLIIPPDNKEALAEKIIHLLKNKSIRENIGLNANKRVREYFSVRKQVEKIECVYTDLLNAKKAGDKKN